VLLQSKSKKWMKNPTNHVCLRANLKENGGRCSGSGRKQDLLDLAILYFDGVFGDFGDFNAQFICSISNVYLYISMSI
jgi:hypothetical protein